MLPLITNRLSQIRLFWDEWDTSEAGPNRGCHITVTIIVYIPVDRVNGNILHLHKIKRSQMGNYLCIATNGRPPAVSRMVKVNVNCK